MLSSKAATGMRPTEHAQHLKIGKARELLEFTRRSVDQIAWAVGYEDPASFRRLFHRIIGLSPGDYRQRFSAGATEAIGVLNYGLASRLPVTSLMNATVSGSEGASSRNGAAKAPMMVR